MVKADKKKTKTPETKKTVTPSPKKKANLPRSIFGVKVNQQAIFDTILSERASRRIANHKTKNRAEVSGTGKKPWSQKGTGKARAGTLRSNIFVGGGVVFGPNTQKRYQLKVNKKVKRLALLSALTLKAKNKGIIIDEFKVDTPKTKRALSYLKEKGLTDKRVIFVSDAENIKKSVANLKNVLTLKPTSLLVEKIIWADVLVISEQNLKFLERLVK